MQKIKDLTPDARNANKGTAKGQKLIVSSIQKNGFGRSGLLDRDNNIIAGNKTTEAAVEVFGVDAEPIIVETDGTRPVYVKRTDLDLQDPDPNNPARRLAYLDNLSQHFSFALDAEALMADLEAGLDLEAMDLSLPDLSGLLDRAALDLLGGNGAGRDTEPQIDKAEELRVKWGIELGQLWQMGQHRLICGDCTDRAVVDRVMGGGRAETLIFDPEWDNIPKIDHLKTVLAFSDGGRVGDIVKIFGPPTWLFTWDCVTSWYTPNRPLRRQKLCLWFGDINNYNFNGSHYGNAGDERNVQNTRGEYRFIPDPRGKHLSDVYQKPITKFHSTELHNHSKPLEWIEMLIANCTSGNVYDPFSGSGTTLIACENLNRRCLAIEIDPGYIAVTLERWQTHTGQTPIRVTEVTLKK